MNHEHALLYLSNKENKDALIQLFQTFEISYTMIGDEDLDQSVISLFEKKEISNKQEVFSFNFILFKNDNRDLISAFYHACKEQGISLTHKAILTKHNANWKLHDLLIEIDEEHQFFQKWEALHVLLKEANSLSPDAFTKDSYEPYKLAFLKAYIYIKSTPNKEGIDAILKELQDTRMQLKKS